MSTPPPASSPTNRPAFFAQERFWVAFGLAGLSVLSWAYILYMGWAMQHMDVVDMWMPPLQAWSGFDFFMLVSMWAIMMVAMMVPSASPMIMMFATYNRKRIEQQLPYVPTFVFLAGYLAVWAAFSALASLAQWGLHSFALINPIMESVNPWLSGVLLVAAGGYQFTALKYACLNSCRSPLAFLMTYWRDGTLGAFRMGVRHGLFCLGCCWVLMLILFAVGVMNLLWVAALAIFVLIEKITPENPWIAWGSGFALIAWGIWVLAHGWI
jgi:predicted metal-binding membrane protein